jgi:hypothetical protein
MPLSRERTELSGGAAAMGLGVEVEEEEGEIGAFGEGSVELRFRAERGILSCTRLQLFCATQWLRRGRLPSSRRVHWYDVRVIGKRIYM